MPWNTVDMITMAPRSVDAADMQNKEVQQHQHTQDQIASTVQQNVEQRAQQTVESQRSETEQYDMDDGSGRGAAGGGSRRRKKKKEEKEAPMAPKSNSQFDIMI